MPGSLLKLPLYPWNPGMVTADAGVRMDPALAASELTNFTIGESGALAARPGFRGLSALVPMAGVIRGIYVGRFPAGYGGEFIVVSWDRESDYRQNHYLLSQFGNTSISSGATGPWKEAPDYLTIGDVLLIASRGGKIMSYHAYAPVSYEPELPDGGLLAWHNSRLFVGRLNTNPSAVAFSSAGNWRSFRDPREAGLLDISNRSGDEVTALTSYYGDFFAFTDRTLVLLDVTNPLFPQKKIVSQSLGCAGHRTVCQVGNDLVWVSDRGVHSLQATNKYGDVEEAFLSAPIQSFWDQIPVENLRLASAAYLPNEGLYVLTVDCGQVGATLSPSVPLASFDQSIVGWKMLCLHVVSKRWFLWDFPATAVAAARDMVGLSTPALIVGTRKETTTLLGWMNPHEHFDIIQVTDRVGHEDIVRTMPKLHYKSVWIDCGDVSVKKNFSRIVVHFSSGSYSQATVSWQIDERGQSVGGYRTPTGSGTFYCNPRNQIPAFSMDPAHEIALVAGGIVLGGLDGNPDFAPIGMEGSGYRIQIAIDYEAGHRLVLYGLDLYYTVESSGQFPGEAVEHIEVYAPPAGRSGVGIETAPDLIVHS